MWAYKLSLEITTYSSLILGCFVLWQNRKIRINQVFFVFSILVAIYTEFLKRGGYALSGTAAVFNLRIMYVGVILIPVVYYHLTMLMLNRKPKLLPWFYASAAFFLAFLPTALFISGPRYFEVYKIFSQRPGILYYPFLIFFFATIAYSIYTAFKKYQTSHGLKKTQLAYFIYGSAIGFFGGSLDYLPKFGIFIHPLNTYCNFLITLYLASFAYAIIKYRLMDIRVIIRKGLLYSVLIAISTGIYLFAIFAIGQIMQVRTGYNPFLIGGLIIFVFVFAFQPLKNKVQEIIDKMFFKSKYDYQKTIKNLSQMASSAVDLASLLNTVSKTVKNSLGVNKSAIYILDQNEAAYKLKGN
ncbi:histidine kinase N-terminal 7TM domain-containing protein [Candidatus Margulisiibacteriota bacterium]